MEIVNFLAELWGFSLIILSFALLINEKNIQRVFQISENEVLAFIEGVVLVVAGLLLVLSYNSFSLSWELIITILGCLTLLKGIVILFMQNLVLKVMAYFRNRGFWIQIMLVITVVLGCALVYLGFTAI